jgi:hypothetical protein
MSARTIAITGAALVLLLAGCTPPAEEPSPPGDAEEAESEVQDCLVGAWQLDVADYGAQSADYLSGLGVPIVDVAMSGAGTLTFTEDNLVAVDIALTTTGTIVVPDHSVPLSVPSTYTASGDWSRVDDDTVQFDNWSRVDADEAPVALPDDAEVPALDFTQLSDVAANCDAGSLSLAAPGVPLTSNWTR